MKFWKRKPALGVGIGVGLLGAFALTVRYAMHRATRQPIPEEISPSIFATRVAQTTHGEIIYHIAGSGEPMVFLHGIFLGASSYEWSKVYPHFVANHEVIVPDLIGFGESERPFISMDATDIAESLAEFLHAISHQPSIIVASGLTADISLLLTARYPKLVSRLILLSPPGMQKSRKLQIMGLPRISGLLGIRRFVYRNYFARPQFIRNWLLHFALFKPHHLTEEMVHVIATCAQQYGAERAIWNLLRGRFAFDVEKCLPDVMVPVYILWPDRTSEFPAFNEAGILRCLPNASIEVLNDCGLLAALENPELVAGYITKCLNGELPIPEVV